VLQIAPDEVAILLRCGQAGKGSTGQSTQTAAPLVITSVRHQENLMTSAVSGGVRVLLRCEGLLILVVSLLAYAKFGSGWGIFALFFLAPDVSFAGYLAGPQAGAITYNAAHSLGGALVVLAAGFFLSIPIAITAGIIWLAHIGFDRALGYGLKYSAGFKFTHLGVIGKGRVGA